VAEFYDIKVADWSEDFWIKSFERFKEMVEHRAMIGQLKYEGAGRRSEVDCLHMLKARTDKYEATANPEFLVDVAVLAMIEFQVMGGERAVRPVDTQGRWQTERS
jgi:hypothetical protein